MRAAERLEPGLDPGRAAEVRRDAAAGLDDLRAGPFGRAARVGKGKMRELVGAREGVEREPQE